MGSMTGGERIARMLEAEGVEVVFGIIDGSYFGLYSRLRDHGIRLVTPRHETSAVHMAGAYARLTGRLGVCIASNGPGAANALPGIAVENGEGNRVLLITSWRRSPIVGPDRGGTYQYFDQVAVMRPMTRWSGAATRFERIPEVMRRAFRQAWHGRPGAVHVCVPEDVINGEFEAPDVPDPGPERYRRRDPIAPGADPVRRAADWLAAARQPLLHVGSGVVHAGAAAEVRELAELLRAPVTTSWGARDAMDERCPESIPMCHVALVDRVRNEADVVLALGSRFGETDWWGKPPYWRSAAEQRLIQVDVDEEILGLNKPVDLAVVADVRSFLVALLAVLKERDLAERAPARDAQLRAYRDARAEDRAELDKALETDGSPLHPAHVATIARELLDDDAILVIDGGNTAIWASFYWEVRQPGTLLSTWKFGMLGAGVAQALGAAVARPGRQVVCILGDGAMGFHPQEIETAVRNALPVVYVVLCDRQWGMVKVNQEFAIDPERTLREGGLPVEQNINTDLGEIRFDRLAESMGARGERAESPPELRRALERCLEAGGPAVVHVDVDRVAHKFAPSLVTFKAMHQEPGG
jgi:acetolactate synthase-1/2/3 large subunit